MATAQELFDKVNEAIAAKMDGNAVQSHNIGGKSIQYYSLTELKELRADLKRELDSGKDTRNYAGFRRPS